MPIRILAVRDDVHPIFRHITQVVRAFGFLIAIGMWFIAGDLLMAYKFKIFIPWYTLILAAILSFTEMIWLLNKCACCGQDGRGCCACWVVFLWFDHYRKTIVYTLLSVPCFIPILERKPLGIVAGCLMLFLAVCYLVKAFKYCNCMTRDRRSEQLNSETTPIGDKTGPSTTSPNMGAVNE